MLKVQVFDAGLSNMISCIGHVTYNFKHFTTDLNTWDDLQRVKIGIDYMHVICHISFIQL